MKKSAGLLLIFLIPLIQLGAQSFTDNIHWGFKGSLFYYAANNGVDSDPAPILPTAGFSAAWQFWGPLRIEFTEDIYATNYEFNTRLGYPMACKPENRSAFVLGFLTGIQLTAVFPVFDNGTVVRVYGGPAADFRIVGLAFGLNHPDDFKGDETDARLQTNAIREHFWSKGRWLMPVIGAGMDFPLTEKVLLGFDIRVWMPIYKIWAKDNTSTIDGWRFGIGFRITPRKQSDELSGRAVQTQSFTPPGLPD